jgi:DNA repair protein RadC
LLARLLRHAAPFHEARRMAEMLLTRFGSVPAVLFADAELLTKAGASDPARSELALARTLQEDIARARIRDRPLITAWSDLVAYCRIMMGESRVERFRVLFLDRRNALIADEEFAQGSIDHVAVYPRRVLSRALELDAAALILAHNHPSGDTAPSQEDAAITGRIQSAARLFDITVHDHIIISHASEFSFRSAGLI